MGGAGANHGIAAAGHLVPLVGQGALVGGVSHDLQLRAGDGSGGQVGGDHRGLGVGKGDLVVDHALVGVDADIHSAGHNGIGVSGNQLVGAEHLFVDALHIALQGVDQNVGGQFVLGGGDTAGGAGSHVVGQGDGLVADVADHGLVAGGDHTVGQGAGTVIRHLSAVQDALDVRGADRVLVGIQNQDGLLRNAGGESAGGSVGASGHILHVPDILVVGVAVNQLGELLVAVDSHGAVVELHGIAGQNVGAAAAGGSQIRHALAVHGVGIGSLKVAVALEQGVVVGFGELQGGGGAVHQKHVQGHIAGGAAGAAQDIGVVLLGGHALSVEQNHVGQIGLGGLGHKSGALVYVRHLVVADGHAVLVIAVHGREVEGHGVLVHGHLIAGAVLDTGSAGIIVGGEGAVHVGGAVAVGAGRVGAHDGLDGQNILVVEAVLNDIAGSETGLVLLAGVANGTAEGQRAIRLGGGVVLNGGAQEALQLLNAVVLLLRGGQLGEELLAHVLRGGIEVQGVKLLGAIGQQNLHFAGGVGVGAARIVAGIQDQGIVAHALGGGTVSDHVVIGVEDEVVVDVKVHAVLGAAVQHVELVGVVGRIRRKQDVRGVVLGAAHGDGLLLGLAGGVGLHLAGHNVGGGDMVLAAVRGNQNQIALRQVGVGHDVLVVDGLVLVEGVQSGGLLGVALGDDLGQSLLQVQDVLNNTVAVVVDGGHLHAIGIGLAVDVGEAAGLGVKAQRLSGVGLAVHHTVVDIVGGVLVGGQAGALQEVLHGVLRVSGGLDHVAGIIEVHAQHGGVGENGGLLGVHGHGLAQHVGSGGHVEHDLALHLFVLAGGGVGGSGGVDLHVLHGGLALGGGKVAVGVVQRGLLVGDNHALNLVNTVLGAQQGAVVGEGDGIAVLVLLNHLDVQSVVDQQRRVVAGQRIAGGSGQVIKDAQGRGQRGGLDGPVVAGQALELRVVAGGH